MADAKNKICMTKIITIYGEEYNFIEIMLKTIR